jgi:glycosyltransferase involved in cell wall biosynthesis
MPLKIACYGLVERDAGSVASANHVILRELLRRGHEIDLYGIRGYVEPREFEGEPNYRYVGHRLRIQDIYDKHVPLPIRRRSWVLNGAIHNALLREIGRDVRRRHDQRRYDLMLFLGLPAQFAVPEVPVVAWLQGPPNIELDAIRNNKAQIVALSGALTYLQLNAFYKFRELQRDRRELRQATVLVCGSPWSVERLVEYGVDRDAVLGIPYPIDLEAFNPGDRPASAGDPLRLLWLGRVTPRKRLDLFVEAILLLLQREPNLSVRVIGRPSYAEGYMTLLDKLPAEKLQYEPHISRTHVPELLQATDILVQPSENENFGSSPAEALACGATTVVGPSNGTSAFVREAGFVFGEYTPASVCDALSRAVAALREDPGALRRRARAVAEREFSVDSVVDALETSFARAQTVFSAH